ncbi:uncharacterized protein L969DRAFT_93310 [Mixia osmundae IAM 14324]|uniref:Mitochondrial glycine transporter n=1 Tax=Mixia osmundae (strain CBS 9802 / IAM 14324 / JCM 22182 / KY 12970) TaxID=764103 RepID=G7E5G1_MIXOS|nr:uncharacterized protein L969DRAFT_93310 [Mixia osmundae IAM 14324]KEI40778.1 hypothetical protein L969DRAFT_93310 [Mixia osmundae IAM 14324]GAA98071.1 hypothetical protein E5Q_04753 [Mixia osmundae IAM 14324]
MSDGGRGDATQVARLPPAHLHLLSGALSGLASCVVLQPLDLVKTRLQQGSPSTQQVRIVSAAVHVVKDDGILGLWRGTLPTIARNVPGVACYMFMLTRSRLWLSTLPQFAPRHPAASPSSGLTKQTALPKLTPTGDLLAGSISRTLVGFVLMPVTVLKTRMESSLYPRQGLIASFRTIWAPQQQTGQIAGVRALWSGFVPTALRDAPYAGLFVVFYERSKTIVGKIRIGDRDVPRGVRDGIAGSLGATLATLMTAPFDTLKTKRQLRPETYKTIWQSSVLIWQQRGFLGFFDGVSLRVARKAGSSAIAWSLYEGLIRRWALPPKT